MNLPADTDLESRLRDLFDAQAKAVHPSESFDVPTFRAVESSDAPRKRSRVLLVTAAAVVATLVVVGSAHRLATSPSDPALSTGAPTTLPGASPGDASDLVDGLGPPVPLASGFNAVGAPVQVSIRTASTGRVTDGYCIESDQGGGAWCASVGGADVRFMVTSAGGSPNPYASWTAPPGISTIVVTWASGDTKTLTVRRPYGPAEVGFAAVVMAAEATDFSYVGYDADGNEVSSGTRPADTFATGTLTGTAVPCIGLTDQPLPPVEVEVRTAGPNPQVVGTQTVAAMSPYRFELPPGDYMVGEATQGAPTISTTVEAHRTTKTDLPYCK